MRNHPNRDDVAAAEHALALLNEQADEVRADIVRSRRELAKVQRDIGGSRAAQLLEANEQLVLAALQAESIAEEATGHLDELARSSQRDALTDTPNRALMLDRLENAIALARRHVTRIAVIFLDLDQFKQINDTLGHAVGDEVLQLVARRLESVVRASDTVSRHGGDEFLVLIGEISRASDAGVIAAKILAVLTAPSRVGDPRHRHLPGGRRGRGDAYQPGRRRHVPLQKA
jgi:diguanylate cyclase